MIDLLWPEMHVAGAEPTGEDAAAPDDVDPDDEELDVTPPDVVLALGFDPKLADDESVQSKI